MHHRLLHNPLLKEEARSIVVEVEPELDEREVREGSHVTGSEGMSRPDQRWRGLACASKRCPWRPKESCIPCTYAHIV
jgi:hypothetical protein